MTSRGPLGLRSVVRGDVPGIEVIAAVDVQEVPHVSTLLDVDLDSASIEFDLDVRVGTGLCVRARTFARDVRKSEIGIFAVPRPRAVLIHDHAVVARSENGITIGVVDGLDGFVASQRALDELVRNPARRLDRVITAAHSVSTGTRGLSMTLVRIDKSKRVEHLGVGNITTRLLGRDGTHHRLFSNVAGSVGNRIPRTLRLETNSLTDDDLLVITTGLAGGIDLQHDPSLKRHPIEIAESLGLQFAFGSEDALVAVIR